MSRLRPRAYRLPAATRDLYPMAKGFTLPQKDNSKRYRRRVKLNNYKEEKRA